MIVLRLDLISDIYMYQFIERGTRDSVSCKCERHGEANNKYMKDYDPGEESNNIMYLDVNNPCGWTMSQPSLTEELKWVDNEELDLKKYHQNGDKGLMMEVDV